MPILSPQDFVKAFEDRTGRSITAEQIAQIKRDVPGWQNGVDSGVIDQFLGAPSGPQTFELPTSNDPTATQGGGLGGPAPALGDPTLTGPIGQPPPLPTPVPTPPPNGTPPPGTTPPPQQSPFPTFTPPPVPTPGQAPTPPPQAGPAPVAPPMDGAPVAPPYQPEVYTPTAPPVAPPAFNYESFKYDDFKAPTIEQAQAEPGYEFAMKNGRDALLTSKAAMGTARTGGTLKDLFSWGNKYGEQNYGNVYNREANTYQTNRGNAFGNWSANRENAADAYATNYGVSRDVFDRGNQQNMDTYSIQTGTGADAYDRNRTASLGTYDRNQAAGQTAFDQRLAGYDRNTAAGQTAYDQDLAAFDRNTQAGNDAYDRTFAGAVAAFNPQFEGAKLTFDDLYKRWRDRLNATTSIATAGAY